MAHIGFARFMRCHDQLHRLAGVAAALVIGAVVFVPQEKSVTPPIATLTDAHAVRSSLQDDAVSSLVPLAVRGGFGR